MAINGQCDEKKPRLRCKKCQKKKIIIKNDSSNKTNYLSIIELIQYTATLTYLRINRFTWSVFLNDRIYPDINNAHLTNNQQTYQHHQLTQDQLEIECTRKEGHPFPSSFHYMLQGLKTLPNRHSKNDHKLPGVRTHTRTHIP